VNLLTAVADVPSRSALRDASNGNFVVLRTRLKLGGERFLSPLLLPEIAGLLNSKLYDQLQSSNVP
jgi:hypothetical protein